MQPSGGLGEGGGGEGEGGGGEGEGGGDGVIVMRLASVQTSRLASQRLFVPSERGNVATLWLDE